MRKLIFLALLLCSTSLAQLDPQAQALLNQARERAAQAQANYDASSYSLEQPLWREALELGERALSIDPNSPAIHRFLAESYQAIGWTGRANDLWERYASFGGTVPERQPSPSVLEPLDALQPAQPTTSPPSSPVSSAQTTDAAPTVTPSESSTAATPTQTIRVPAASESSPPSVSNSPSTSQDGDAASLLARAQQRAQEARVRYAGTVFNIDQPLWQEALNLGERAAVLEPTSLPVRRFLAQSYSAILWHVRAWDAWREYLAVGGNLNAEDWELFATSGRFLAFSRYERGDLEAAQAFHEVMHAINPNDAEAILWLGRLHFEQGRSEQARAFWQRAADRDLSDSAAYFLARSEQQIRYGIAASDAFYEGVSHYEAGDLRAALRSFTRAVSSNPNFPEALVWAGRSSLELGQPQSAERYWQAVLELDPEDSRAQHFVSLAQEQQRWGVDAVNAFQEGVQRYEAGDIQAALQAFAQASDANPNYPDALVWTARSHQELGQAAQAARFWRRVLELDPDDSRAAYFLRLAEEQAGESSSNPVRLEPFLPNLPLPEASDSVSTADSSTDSSTDSTADAATVSPAAPPSNPAPTNNAAAASGQLSSAQRANAQFNQALNLYQQARLDDAEAGFQAVVDLDASYTSAWAWLGRIHFDRGNYQRAATYYQEAATLEPSNSSYQFFAQESQRLANSQ